MQAYLCDQSRRRQFTAPFLPFNPLQSDASGRSMDLPAYAIEAEGLFKTYPASKTAPEKRPSTAST
jgi:hypothetical protein